MQNKNLINEIRNLYSTIIDKNMSYKLLNASNEFDSYYITDGDYKGVGFEIDEKFKDFKYEFANIKIIVDQRLNINRENKFFIELLSNSEISFDDFIYVCIKFLEGNENRKMILNNPQEWIDEWKNLFGNKISEDSPYPDLGELIILKYLVSQGKRCEMTHKGSHDIETNDENYEVKTSTMRYDTLIEIHSKNQLAKLNNNELYLMFVRLEESISGVSINGIIDELKKMNYNVENIEKKFRNYNTVSLNKKYKIDEIRKYKVDEKFPKIVDETFKDGHLPQSIVKLTYTVDLDGLSYEKIDYMS